MYKFSIIFCLALLGSGCSAIGGMGTAGGSGVYDESNKPYSMRHDLKPGDTYYGI